MFSVRRGGFFFGQNISFPRTAWTSYMKHLRLYLHCFTMLCNVLLCEVMRSLNLSERNIILLREYLIRLLQKKELQDASISFVMSVHLYIPVHLSTCNNSRYDEKKKHTKFGSTSFNKICPEISNFGLNPETVTNITYVFFSLTSNLTC